MTEDEIKAEMRLFVMETLLALLWASSHMTTPDPAASLESIRSKLLQKAKAQTFAGLHPSHSDLLSAELEAEIEQAMQLQARWMGIDPRTLAAPK